jgi:Holliday junction DNA helicase RuvA
LRGTLAEKQPPHLILDVNGLGYELEVPMTTLYRLPSVGEPLTLHTHLVVREDAQLLYGFVGKRERDFFRELIRLNGVGPKLALALMSSLEVDELVRCVQSQDTSALTKVPGVGKKTAERLLVEMRDRLRDWQIDGAAVAGGDARSAGRGNDHLLEAESALIALGYTPQEAARMIAGVNKEAATTSESLIRLALKSAAKN